MNIVLEIINQYPVVIAFILGLIPALIWLTFWIKEDTNPEPLKMIFFSFVGGMLAVWIVLPLQKSLYPYVIHNDIFAYSVFAFIEEFFKFLMVYIIALRSKLIDDEPVDNIIYLIVSALGFVALENTLFLLDPLESGNIVKTLITGNMRFIGASLVHIISSGTIGIWLAFAFYKNTEWKSLYFCIGLLLAVVLHTLFNLLIISIPEKSIMLLFVGVWFMIALLLLIFERVKHIQKPTL